MMNIFPSFLIVSGFLCTAEGIMPEENEGVEGLYQGDILLNEAQQTAVRSGTTKGFGDILWPGGVVPYVFSKEIASTSLSMFIKHAFMEWEHYSCIKFKPRTTETAYLMFLYGKGCYSYVGYQGNKQILSLGLDCFHKGIILHEIGHALGFFHEQARPDRDMYITIHNENIRPGKSSNFNKMTHAQMQSWMPFGTPYDYSSIMHFSSYAFTKNKKPTITDKYNRIPVRYIGQRDYLSALDVKQINLMYNCPGNATTFFAEICEGKSGRIICFGGRKIKVIYANYGRKRYQNHCGFGLNTKCESTSSFEKVKEVCNGRSSCELHATDDEFEDPCPWTKKYLAVRYQCHP